MVLKSPLLVGFFGENPRFFVMKISPKFLNRRKLSAIPSSYFIKFEWKFFLLVLFTLISIASHRKAFCLSENPTIALKKLSNLSSFFCGLLFENDEQCFESFCLSQTSPEHLPNFWNLKPNLKANILNAVEHVWAVALHMS